jgi:hypothetical protein
MPIVPSKNIKVFKFGTAGEPDFFKGSMDYKNLNWDPFVNGYAFIVWLKVPFWIKDMFGDLNVKAFLEKNFQGLSGLSDMDLQMGTQNHGFAANEADYTQNLQKGNKDFSIKMQEYSGSPVKNLFQAWVSGIRDPESGIATYPKRFGCDYAAKNHTGRLLYIVTRPDANNTEKNNIEFACMWDKVQPKKIPFSHLNFDKGTHDNPEIDIDFSGVFRLSPKVDELAQAKLKETFYLREEAEYNPNGTPIGGGEKLQESVSDVEISGLFDGNEDIDTGE